MGLVESFLMSLAVNKLTDLSDSFFKSLHELHVGEELLAKIERRKNSFEPIMEDEIREKASNMNFESTLDDAELALFVQSNEVQSIFRKLFVSKICEENEEQEHIREEFIRLGMKRFNLKEYDQAEKEFNNLFQKIVNSIVEALDFAIKTENLDAHDAKQTLHFNLLKNELKQIKTNIDFLKESESLTNKDISQFKNKIISQIESRNSKILPPHFHRKTKKISIDDIFVEPQFVTDQSTEDNQTTLSLSGFVEGIHRTVLLGDPGAGKSTLSQKLLTDISRSNFENIDRINDLIPVKIVLREYADKKSEGYSFLDFLSYKTNKDHQIKAPEGAIEYLLRTGQMFVVFDGMDELLDTSLRREISKDIESFSNLYPSVPILVTSRKVGYKQAPLDSEVFEVFYLRSFDEEQIKEYSRNWFMTSDDELSDDEKRQNADNFLEESEVVEDLRTNPLLLSLMCNIYRGQNYIPQNRPDVYKKCSNMLFEKWDKSRGIEIDVPFKKHVQPAIKYLGYWIFTKDDSQGGIARSDIKSKVVDYLSGEFFRERFEAEQAAEELIEFCTGRGWVFRDIGTTSQGEPLYEFVHQTFLEYYASEYIVKKHFSPEKLLNFLIGKIKKREWNEVSKLSFQILSEKVEVGRNKLFKLSLERLQKFNGEEMRNTLTFLLECLEFLVPKPELRGRVVKQSIKTYIESLKDFYEVMEQKYDLDINIVLSEEEFSELELSKFNTDLVDSIFSAHPENQKIMIDELKDFLGEKIQEEVDQSISKELYLELPFSLNVKSNFELAEGKLSDNWENFKDEVVLHNQENYRSNWNNNILLAMILLIDFQLLNFDDFIEEFSLVNLFEGYYYKSYPSIQNIGSSQAILSTLILYSSNKLSLVSEKVTSRKEFLGEISTYVIDNDLLPIELPEYEPPFLYEFPVMRGDYHTGATKNLSLTNFEWTGLIFLIAVEAEKFFSDCNTQEEHEHKFHDFFDELDSDNTYVNIIVEILEKWIHEEDADINNILSSVQFNDNQIDFINSWLTGHRKFVNITS